MYCFFLYSIIVSGWFARDPSVLHRVGHALLQLNSQGPKRTKRIIFADDLFQLLKVPTQRTVHVIGKAIENLSGCKFLAFEDQLVMFSVLLVFQRIWLSSKALVFWKYLMSWPKETLLSFMKCFGSFDFADQSSKHMNLCQHIASSVPSLKGYCEQSTHQQNGAFILKALSSVMLSLQG